MPFRSSIALLRTQSDDRLLRLARGGSETAFAAILERYRRTLTRACRRVLPPSRVDDAVQQTFIAAWSALRRGDEVRDLRGWLLRIARNTSLNALRVNGYDDEALSESLVLSEAPPDELERREAVRATLSGLAALPGNQRDALLRSALDGTPHAQIARDLGVTEGAVRQLVLRARTTLRGATTALTPIPLLSWFARTSAMPTAHGAVELASAGGASVALVKVGAVLATASGAVGAAPAIPPRADAAVPVRDGATAVARYDAEPRRTDGRSTRTSLPREQAATVAVQPPAPGRPAVATLRSSRQVSVAPRPAASSAPQAVDGAAAAPAPPAVAQTPPAVAQTPPAVVQTTTAPSRLPASTQEPSPSPSAETSAAPPDSPSPTAPEEPAASDDDSARPAPAPLTTTKPAPAADAQTQADDAPAPAGEAGDP